MAKFGKTAVEEGAESRIAVVEGRAEKGSPGRVDFLEMSKDFKHSGAPMLTAAGWEKIFGKAHWQACPLGSQLS